MISWILGLVSGAGNTVAGLANTVTQKILGVYNFFLSFFLRVRNAVVAARAAVVAFVAAQVGHALAVLNTIRWLITVFVPNLLASLRDQITKWVTGLITFTQALIGQAVRDLTQWVSGLVAFTQLLATQEARHLQAGLDALGANVTRLINQVFGVLGTPDRLVAWIIGSLTSALGRWALDNAARLGRLLFRWVLAETAAAASLAESIIVRII